MCHLARPRSPRANYEGRSPYRLILFKAARCSEPIKFYYFHDFARGVVVKKFVSSTDGPWFDSRTNHFFFFCVKSGSNPV